MKPQKMNFIFEDGDILLEQNYVSGKTNNVINNEEAKKLSDQLHNALKKKRRYIFEELLGDIIWKINKLNDSSFPTYEIKDKKLFYVKDGMENKKELCKLEHISGVEVLRGKDPYLVYINLEFPSIKAYKLGLNDYDYTI